MRKEDINIGRYYNTNTGRGGKFGFGCQSSTDPQDFFDMAEIHITYTAGEEDNDSIKAKLDTIYDKAGVPEKERMYQLDGSEDEYKSFHDSFHKYFFEPDKTGKGGFAGDNGVEKKRFTDAHLCQARLWLGLIILSDINEEGYCELDAEL